MVIAMTDDQILLLVASIVGGLLVLTINLLLLYLVIRLAITHGMLSYNRQLEEDRRHQRYVERHSASASSA